MFSVRLCASAAVLLLFAIVSRSGGDGLPVSRFADGRVYTFAYNSRSRLAQSNITTDAQVCESVLMKW